jgi:RHS repeat-associated protein
MKTYTYDAENRLTSVMEGASPTTYTYNGDGDRMSQTVDGMTTSYVLDTATPLTMVLAETTGAETIYYLHGLDLVAQNDGVSTEYFGYDGLGSVRQMLDSSGSVFFAQVFDPYGNQYASAGVDSTNRGFTGEQTDSNGLIFLRARFYNPRQGRFLQRDPWKGNENSPVSFNPWLYVSGNPINQTDPSGMCLDEDMDGKCDSGWQCALIPDPIAWKACWQAFCKDPMDEPLGPFIEYWGQSVYDTYIALRDHSGWWHNTEDKMGKFSPHDMLEVLLSIEFNGVAARIPRETQKEIGVRNFYAICHDRGGWCNSRSGKDVIEFIAAKQLILIRNWFVPKGADPTGVWNEPGYKKSKADFSVGFKNPDGWTGGVGNLKVPYDWGNLQMFTYRFPANPERYREAFEAPGGREGEGGKFIAGNEFYYYLYPGDRNAFIVLNRLQTKYWYRPISTP